MLFHKNRKKQIPVCSIQQHLGLEKPVKLVKYVVSFIGKELAEDRFVLSPSPMDTGITIYLFRKKRNSKNKKKQG